MSGPTIVQGPGEDAITVLRALGRSVKPREARVRASTPAKIEKIVKTTPDVLVPKPDGRKHRPMGVKRVKAALAELASRSLIFGDGGPSYYVTALGWHHLQDEGWHPNRREHR